MPYYETSGTKTPPNIADDNHWQEEWGSEYTAMQPFYSGQAMDAKYFPTSGYLKEGAKDLHQIIPKPRLICDAQVRNVIESIEPGVHNFYPYSVRASKTSKKIVAEYFIINICNSLNIFDPDNTDEDFFTAYPPNESRTEFKFVLNKVTLRRKTKESKTISLSIDKKRMAGKHLVLDPRASYGDRFYSDEMYEALKPFMEPTSFFTMLKTC